MSRSNECAVPRESQATADGIHQRETNKVADASTELSLLANGRDSGSSSSFVVARRSCGGDRFARGYSDSVGQDVRTDNTLETDYKAGSLGWIVNEDGIGSRVAVAEPKDGKVDFTLKVGEKADEANKYVSELGKSGYELKVIFGPDTQGDANKDIWAYQDTKATAGMNAQEALSLVKDFCASTEYRQAKIVHESVKRTCLDAIGRSPVHYAKSCLEIIGNNVDSEQYAKLNGALKVLEANKLTARMCFE